MSPPQLSTDTPIFDVFEPVTIGVFVLRGIKLNIVVHDRLQGKVGKVLHFQKPLCGQLWLNGHMGALGVSNFVVVVLHFFHQSRFFQIFCNLLAHVHTIHSHVHSCFFRNSTIVVKDIDGLKSVFQTQCMVINIMCWRYL